MTQTSRVSLTIDLDRSGTQAGDAMLRWSDNSTPLGYHPIPVVSIKGADGPVLLLVGGTHGDEFEGPSAIMRVLNAINPTGLRGQIIAFPALNMPRPCRGVAGLAARWGKPEPRLPRGS